MNRKTASIRLLSLALLLFFTGCKYKKDVQQETEKAIQKIEISPLETYVNTKDDAFEYKLVDEVKEPGYTFYVIRMVSQK